MLRGKNLAIEYYLKMKSTLNLKMSLTDIFNLIESEGYSSPRDQEAGVKA